MRDLSGLREEIRRIERPAATEGRVLPTGLAAIDRALPGGGLPLGALHEILGHAGDEEDGVLAAAFAAHLLGRLTTAAEGLVLWGLPRPDLYGPGLFAGGLDPARLVLVTGRRDAEILWAVEEGLRSPGLAAVVGEVGQLSMVASRRLQLAAERAGIPALLLRRWKSGGEAARERNLPNAAATRWRIAALLSAGLGRPRWRVELLRCRGGAPAAWEIEVADATHTLSVVAALADRPAPPRRVVPAAEERHRRAG